MDQAEDGLQGYYVAIELFHKELCFRDDSALIGDVTMQTGTCLCDSQSSDLLFLESDRILALEAEIYPPPSEMKWFSFS